MRGGQGEGREGWGDGGGGGGRVGKGGKAGSKFNSHILSINSMHP